MTHIITLSNQVKNISGLQYEEERATDDDSINLFVNPHKSVCMDYTANSGSKRYHSGYNGGCSFKDSRNTSFSEMEEETQG